MLNQFSQAKWADFTEGQLHSLEGHQPLQMHNSDGTALPLVVDDSKEQRFGADIVRFAPGTGVGLHIHVGAHILMVTKGNGLLTYGQEKHRMFPGMIYLIPSNTPHAIEAISELVLVAIGSDHRPADSEERLEIVNREEKKE